MNYINSKICINNNWNTDAFTWITFFFGTEGMAKSSVPDIIKRTLRVWIWLVLIVTMGYLLLGVVLIFSRDIEISSAKKVLSGTGIGYLFIIARVFKHMIDFQKIPEVVAPIPTVIIVLLLAVWTFYEALVKKNPSE